MRSESDHTLVTVTFSRGTLLLMSPSIAPCARTLYLVAHPRFQSYQDAVTYTELAYEDVPPSVMYPALHHAPGPLSDWIRFQRSRTEESTLPGDPQRFANLVLTNPSCLRELEEFNTFLSCTRPDLGAGDSPDTLETLAIANPPPPTLSYLDYDATERRRLQTEGDYRIRPGGGPALSISDVESPQAAWYTTGPTGLSDTLVSRALANGWTEDDLLLLYHAQFTASFRGFDSAIELFNASHQLPSWNLH